jgi:hypothetical protein
MSSARSTLCAAVVGIAVFAASAVPANAGLLDFIFKPRGTTAPVAVEASAPPLVVTLSQTHVKDARIARTTPHKKPAAEIEPRKPKSASCCKPGEDPVAYLMHDQTLRPGDAIVTKEGIRIFEGPVSSHHLSSDFAPLREARNVGSKNRAALAQVDAPAGESLSAVASADNQIEPKAAAQASRSRNLVAMADR